MSSKSDKCKGSVGQPTIAFSSPPPPPPSSHFLPRAALGQRLVSDPLGQYKRLLSCPFPILQPQGFFTSASRAVACPSIRPSIRAQPPLIFDCFPLQIGALLWGISAAHCLASCSPHSFWPLICLPAVLCHNTRRIKFYGRGTHW